MFLHYFLPGIYPSSSRGNPTASILGKSLSLKRYYYYTNTIYYTYNTKYSFCKSMLRFTFNLIRSSCLLCLATQDKKYSDCLSADLDMSATVSQLTGSRSRILVLHYRL